MFLPGEILHAELRDPGDRLPSPAGDHRQPATWQNPPPCSRSGRTPASAVRSGTRSRLAVIVATLPLAKRTRALAMSSCGLATAAPTASTLSIGLVHQGQDQIEVMDHQVQDHRNVRSARLERCDPGRLDIERPADSPCHCAVRGGESLQMADLQHEPPLGRERGEFVRFGSRVAAIGFSTSTCLLRPVERRRRVVMRARRARPRSARHSRRNKLVKAERRRARLPARPSSRVPRRDRGFPPAGPLGRRYLERVIAAEMPGAGYADAQSR